MSVSAGGPPCMSRPRPGAHSLSEVSPSRQVGGQRPTARPGRRKSFFPAASLWKGGAAPWTAPPGSSVDPGSSAVPALSSTSATPLRPVRPRRADTAAGPLRPAHRSQLPFARPDDLPSEVGPTHDPLIRMGGAQPEDPNWMGMVMVWVVVQVVWPGGRCQMVSLVWWGARASQPPPGPGARVAVAGGSAGRGRQGASAAVMVWAWLPVRTTAIEPPGPGEADLSAALCSGSGGDRVQRAPLLVDQAASRRAAGPAPAASSAVVVPPVVVSRSTVMCWCMYVAGSVGPAGRQVWPVCAKMPAVPGWAQLAASSGIADELNAAAVTRRSPQWRPAGEAATDRRVARVAQAVPPGPDSSAWPVVSSASRRPLAGAAARASGTSARPASSRPGVQAAPLSWVVASGRSTRIDTGAVTVARPVAKFTVALTLSVVLSLSIRAAHAADVIPRTERPISGGVDGASPVTATDDT